MSSLIPGYHYDIFISYRHKDNKYDGWVSTFVSDLRKELDAMFKDEISIYFDENVQDGLHENHDVDDSLKDKIRCAVFIPIVSRTYCDPHSFAWTKEFLAFRDFATTDAGGLKVKTSNGNVASRILPVRINDLDPDDVKMFEKELGSVMRPVDFIFKSAGINRPLTAADERREHQSVFYRDQLNKVAMAVREIMTGLRQPKSQGISSTTNATVAPRAGSSLRKFLVPAIILLVLISVGWGLSNYLKSNGSDTGSAEVVKNPSIAVLPFADISAEKDQEYFCDGLTEELLNVLAKVPDLKVISRTSAFSFKGKNEDVRSIAEKLDVAYVLEGSIRKAADKVRITAQLIKASDGTHLWSETFDRDMNDVFKVQDEISDAVAKELRVKLLGSGSTQPKESNPEVYNLYLQSKFHFENGSRDTAYALIEKALAIDSSDARVWSLLGSIYIQKGNSTGGVKANEANRRKALYAAEKAIALDPNQPSGHRVMGNYFTYVWDMVAAEKSLRKAVDLDPTNGSSLNSLAVVLGNLGQFEEAKALLTKSISYDPVEGSTYNVLGYLQFYEGNYEGARQNFQKSVSYSSEATYHLRLAQLSLAEGNYQLARSQAANVKEDFWRAYCMTMCLWSNGEKTAALDTLKKFEKQFRETGPFQVAEIHAWMGDDAKAFQWLDTAYEFKDPGLTEIKNSFFFKRLTTDTRYVAMLKKLKLPV